MVKSGAQKARARKIGSKLKFLERVAKEEEEEARTVGRSQKRTKRANDQVECREARVSTGSNERAERKGHKGSGQNADWFC